MPDSIQSLPLDLLRMGYFILYKRGTVFDIFGKGIELRQRIAGFKESDACFTHVEVSGGEVHSINISPPLSKLIDITKEHKGRYIRVVKYRNFDYEEKGRYKIAYFSAALCNTKYDKFGIIRFLIKWVKEDNRKWFCSEGSAWALQKVYPEVNGNLPPKKWMPAHFTKSEFFETVWEGKIPK